MKKTQATRESHEQKRQRAREVMDRLLLDHPEPKIALHFETPYQLLIATILSAQCTDERVNKTTPALFALAPDAASMSKLGLAKIKQAIKSINFFNNKAENILKCSLLLVSRHGGEVPRTLDDLVALPGVGRKTANVVMNDAFGEPGIVVDTHVTRLANRLGFVSRETDAVKIEFALQKLIEVDRWSKTAHLLILHGRQTCKALKPDCERCALVDLCPSAFKKADAWKPPS